MEIRNLHVEKMSLNRLQQWNCRRFKKCLKMIAQMNKKVRFRGELTQGTTGWRFPNIDLWQSRNTYDMTTPNAWMSSSKLWQGTTVLAPLEISSQIRSLYGNWWSCSFSRNSIPLSRIFCIQMAANCPQNWRRRKQQQNTEDWAEKNRGQRIRKMLGKYKEKMLITFDFWRKLSQHRKIEF